MGIYLTLDELKVNVDLQEALKAFIEVVGDHDDKVRFVTVNQVVEWMKNTKTEIPKCAQLPQKVPCQPKVCTRPSRSYKLPQKFTFRICNVDCPEYFPWTDAWNEVSFTKFLMDN